MGAESALLATLITSVTGLCGMCIQKVKCAYRHTEEGCQPACACMDGRLDKESELEVHSCHANGLDLLNVGKKE